MENREKVKSEKDFKLPSQQSPEKIINDSYKTSSVQSLEKIEKTYSIPNAQSIEQIYKRLDVPVVQSRESPLSSYDVPTQKSKENTILGAFTMPVVE
jgi:hypothetical protein